MSEKSPITVHALIPHPEMSDHHLCDEAGDYPAGTHESGKTYEDTLRNLGKNILGIPLSVQARRPELEKEPNHIVYQTKPVNPSSITHSKFNWKPLG